MTARLRNLLLRKSALEPLHCSDESSGEEQEDWIAGSRYQALRDIPLFSRQEPRSEACGTIPRGSVVLVMVLQPHEDELGEAVMAYIADTKIPGWTKGWATISREGWSRPVLGFRRLTGSWELGGRYRVLESLVLRAGMELDSESLCELSKREEVLVLDMGLVLRDGQPRLRAKVRTDSGALGWLTMELPSGPPMLDSMNLLSVRAVKPGCFSKGASSRVARMRPRASVSHERNEVWEVGGMYRAMSSAQLRHDVELNSSSLGTLKKGALATVQDLRRVQWHPNVEGTLRLKVVVGNSSSSTASPPVVGWISAFDGTGEPILDFRDQLEYQKILTLLAPGQDVHSIVVKVHRSQEDGGQKPVGIIVDKSDERSLVVAGFAEDGLMAAWNDRQSNPEDRVRPGDRVVSVNGVIGDRTLLLEQMSAQSLELVIRRDKGASVTSAELRAVHEDEHDLEHADAALTRSIFDHPDDNKSPGSKGSESEHRGRARTADFGPDSDTGSPDSFCRTSSPLCERQQPETLGVEARATDPTYRRPSNSQCYLGQLSERSEAAVISETSVLHHAFGNSSASGPGDGDSQTEERGDYMETGRELLQQHQQQQQQQQQQQHCLHRSPPEPSPSPSSPLEQDVESDCISSCQTQLALEASSRKLKSLLGRLTSSCSKDSNGSINRSIVNGSNNGYRSDGDGDGDGEGDGGDGDDHRGERRRRRRRLDFSLLNIFGRPSREEKRELMDQFLIERQVHSNQATLPLPPGSPGNPFMRRTGADIHGSGSVKEELEWRPVGVCVDEVPDSRLIADLTADHEADSSFRPCRSCDPNKSVNNLFLSCTPSSWTRSAPSVVGAKNIPTAGRLPAAPLGLPASSPFSLRGSSPQA